MELRSRILVASDESSDGRHAIRVARELAVAESADLTILSVRREFSSASHYAGQVLSTTGAEALRTGDELLQFHQWVGPEARNSDLAKPEVAVAFGVPGIEIVRAARERAAEFVVLGRQPRAPHFRQTLGETADAVVRRNDRPTLFVPRTVSGAKTMVLAIDGSDRTRPVLMTAHDLAVRWGVEVTAILVEPDLADERHHSGLPRGATERLGGTLEAMGIGRLVVRRGNPIEEILAYTTATGPDILAIGYRRGGPPKVVGPADIARTLLFSAPSAVLTVPL